MSKNIHTLQSSAFVVMREVQKVSEAVAVDRIDYDSDSCMIDIDTERIWLEVREYYPVTFEELSSKSRKRELVYARQIIMYFLRMTKNYTLAKIGEMFGGRDHSTVCNALNTVSDLIDTDRVYRRNIHELKLKLGIL